MYRKHLAAVLLIILFAAPAFATTHWYVEKNPKTQDCSVTNTKPNGKPDVQVGPSYSTKSAAQAALTACRHSG